MGGVTSEIFDYPELSKVFLPILRNDLKIAETYKFNNHIPIDCDFSILTGENENYTNEQITGWSKLTSKNCNYYQFKGGHFFINNEIKNVVRLINEKLQT